MLVTEREQKIIDAILKNGAQTVQTLIEVTKTSRRTLYRDLQNLQDTLPEYGAYLVKEENGYNLTGDLSAFQHAEKIIDWTQSSRNIAELLMLLMDEASLAKMMQNFGISQPTATVDLKIVEKNLLQNGAKISRDKGLQIIASEFTKRSLMVLTLLKALTTFEILQMTTTTFAANKIIANLPSKTFLMINDVFDHEDSPQMFDRTQAIMRLFFVTSMLRIESGHKVPTLAENNPSKEAIAFVVKIVNRLDVNYFGLPEIMYLASILDSIYFKKNENILFEERIDTDFMSKVRQLISLVSDDFNVDFGRDTSIFGMLNAHLRSILIIPQVFEDEKSTFIQSIK